MGQGGSLAPYAAAADAAGARAGECRRRLIDLEQSRYVTGSDDVLRARTRLAEATARASAARQRLEAARRYREVQQVLRSQHLTGVGGPGMPEDLVEGAQSALRLKTFDWVSTGRVGLKPLWLEFISLGGECGILEFDAYLHGAWEMSERDLSVLEQVCWEYETFGTA